MRVGANCKCLQLCSDPFFIGFSTLAFFKPFLYMNGE
nr:MAG TPA: hypothetical protein [Caudoviricetes sp.]DAQ56585.1 MAG TPA: hypothetical protein [Caudoviricetes sp.]